MDHTAKVAVKALGVSGSVSVNLDDLYTLYPDVRLKELFSPGVYIGNNTVVFNESATPQDRHLSITTSEGLTLGMTVTYVYVHTVIPDHTPTVSLQQLETFITNEHALLASDYDLYDRYYDHMPQPDSVSVPDPAVTNIPDEQIGELAELDTLSDHADSDSGFDSGFESDGNGSGYSTD